MVFPLSSGGESGGEGEGLEFDIIVNASEAIDDLVAWREEIDRVKEEMKALANASKESFAVVRQSLEKQQKESGLDPEVISRNNKLLMIAQQELTDEQREQTRLVAKEKAEAMKSQIASEKAAAEESKRLSRETTQAKLREIQQQVQDVCLHTLFSILYKNHSTDWFKLIILLEYKV